METSQLKELYESYSDSIYHYLKSRSGSDEIAFDLMQETFLKADLYYKDIENVKAWLFTIARNLLIDYMRKRAKRKEIQDEGEFLNSVASGEKMESAIDWKMLKESIVKTLKNENPLFPELFLLRINYELTHEEISNITKIPFRTIRRHFERIRNIIYQNYKDDLNINLK